MGFDYKIIAIAGMLIYIVMVLVRKGALKQYPFDQHIQEDLKSKGLKYLYSKKRDLDCSGSESIPLVSSSLKRHAGMMLFSGSMYSWSGKLYLIFSVGFEDNEKTKHEILAAVEYSGYRKIKVENIS